MNRYFDNHFQRDVVTIYPGEFYSTKENEMISKKVRVKGMAGEFFYGTENSPGNILVLRDEKNNVMIVINSDIDEDSIMRMAKKIKVLK